MITYTPQQKQEAEKRFWSNVVKGGPGKCWLWIGGKTNHGYGQIKWEGKNWPAHRLSYVLNVGPIPEGKCVLHSCDVRNCVAPHDLWIGTKRENNADMVKKKRQARGKRHSRRIKKVFKKHPALMWNPARNQKYKLTKDQAEEIRWIYEQGHSQRKLAAFYGVSQGTISEIICGKRTYAKAILPAVVE